MGAFMADGLAVQGSPPGLGCGGYATAYGHFPYIHLVGGFGYLPRSLLT